MGSVARCFREEEVRLKTAYIHYILTYALFLVFVILANVCNVCKVFGGLFDIFKLCAYIAYKLEFTLTLMMLACGIEPDENLHTLHTSIA